MKIQRSLYILLCAGAVSCTKPSDTADGPGPIELFPYSQQTRSAVRGGILPDDYTVFLSAYCNNLSDPSVSCNYLTAERFAKGTSGWVSDPPVYWPLGGTLDFLAIAAKDVDIRAAAEWYRKNVSRYVAVSVDDGSCLSSEIMYSAVCGAGEKSQGVSLNFSHSQAWLQFRLIPSDDMDTRIDSIVICKAYSGGRMIVDNGVATVCSWDYHGHFRKDITIADSRNLVLTEGVHTLDVLLPEQEACDIRVYYSLKDTRDATWEGDVRKKCFLAPANADPWHAGTRTVYSMKVIGQMTLTASVHGWDEDNRTVNIN